jgi:sugar phosphate permease
MWFGVIGLVSAPTNVVSYTRVVSLWFDERRGLALGVMAAAQGVGAGILPPIVHYATAQGGWPLAVGVIAGIELLICLPSVAMLVREPMNAGAKASPAADPVQGRAQNAQIDSQSLGQIIRRPVFWTLSVAFSIIGFSAYSIGANLAPIFAELAGLDLGKVAQLQSLLGICVIPGRLLTGMALDRFPAHVVAIIVVALNALALALLVSFSDFTIFLVAMAILGFCSGGESNLMPFMAGRIFGVGSVSRVFGWFLFAFFIGALTGPLVLAKSAAQTGSYIAPLLGLLAAQIVIIALFWISAKGSVRPPVPDGAGA